MRASFRGTSGFSLIELVVVITMIAIVTTLAVSSFRASPYELDASVVELVGDLRLARTWAQSRGAHYHVVIESPTQYAIQRLRVDGGGLWQPDASDRRTKTLPSSVRFATGDGTAVEFDTRGTPVALGAVLRISFEERATGAVKTVAVWPSGQVLRDGTG